MSPRQITGEEVRAKHAEALPGIQDIFSSDETFEKISLLAQELKLSASVCSVLGMEAGYAILGLRKPEETLAVFSAHGASPELAEKIVKRIATDILLEVEKIRKETPSITPPELTAPSDEPAHKIVEVDSVVQKSLPAPAQEALLAPAIKSPVFSTNLIRPSPVPSTPPPPVIRPRTMASDVEAIEPETVVATSSPVQPAVPVPPIPKTPPQKTTPVPVPNTSNIEADMKKYGVDPYREPVE